MKILWAGLKRQTPQDRKGSLHIHSCWRHSPQSSRHSFCHFWPIVFLILLNEYECSTVRKVLGLFHGLPRDEMWTWKHRPNLESAIVLYSSQKCVGVFPSPHLIPIPWHHDGQGDTTDLTVYEGHACIRLAIRNFHAHSCLFMRCAETACPSCNCLFMRCAPSDFVALKYLLRILRTTSLGVRNPRGWGLDRFP